MLIFSPQNIVASFRRLTVNCTTLDNYWYHNHRFAHDGYSDNNDNNSNDNSNSSSSSSSSNNNVKPQC